MFINCMTFAFKLESLNLNALDLKLWYSRDPEQSIREKVERFYRSIRRLENKDSKLESDEWLVAFFGFIPIKFDYEGTPEEYDYHFMKYENGMWMHRPSIGKGVFPVEEETFLEYESEGYPAQYFAVRRTN